MEITTSSTDALFFANIRDEGSDSVIQRDESGELTFVESNTDTDQNRDIVNAFKKVLAEKFGQPSVDTIFAKLEVEKQSENSGLSGRLIKQVEAALDKDESEAPIDYSLLFDSPDSSSPADASLSDSLSDSLSFKSSSSQERKNSSYEDVQIDPTVFTERARKLPTFSSRGLSSKGEDVSSFQISSTDKESNSPARIDYKETDHSDSPLTELTEKEKASALKMIGGNPPQESIDFIWDIIHERANNTTTISPPKSADAKPSLQKEILANVYALRDTLSSYTTTLANPRKIVTSLFEKPSDAAFYETLSPSSERETAGPITSKLETSITQSIADYPAFIRATSPEVDLAQLESPPSFSNECRFVVKHAIRNAMNLPSDITQEKLKKNKNAYSYVLHTQALPLFEKKRETTALAAAFGALQTYKTIYAKTYTEAYHASEKSLDSTKKFIAADSAARAAAKTAAANTAVRVIALTWSTSLSEVQIDTK